MSGNLSLFARSVIRPACTCIQYCRAIHHTPAFFDSSSGGLAAPIKKEETFEEMLESSSLMKIRRPQGMAVGGKITNVCNGDLYIDFGGKFEVVVKRPNVRADEYKVGAAVKVLLKKFEMTGHFLGQSRHITLLEADGSLMGLDPNRVTGK